MLVDFSFENFGPFRDKTVFSMDSTKLDGPECNKIKAEKCNLELLSSAAIFGPNASGKSYVLKAMDVLQNLVRAPMPPNVKIPYYMPFRASSGSLRSPTKMGIRYTVDDIVYRYEISFDSEHIVSESLCYEPNGRPISVFVRNGQEFEFKNRTVSKGLKMISQMAALSSAFLPIAAQYNNEVCRNAHKGIVSDIILLGSNISAIMNQVIARTNEDPDFRRSMLRALKIADFGISDIQGNVMKKKVSELGEVFPPQAIGLMLSSGITDIDQVTLNLKHDFKDADVDSGQLYFPFDIESNGTMQFFCLMGPVIDALKNGSVLFLDEFGSYLHSEIGKWVIRQFRDSANPNHAQLIFNTHDQSLMDQDLLRRDQIWFTQKDFDTGASELYCLSDFNGLRPETDIRRCYAAGKYQALPYIPSEDVIE